MMVNELDRLGYDVTGRASPIEALDLYKAKPDYVDLVITDQTMPSPQAEPHPCI